jgi:hypothetical protein
MDPIVNDIFLLEKYPGKGGWTYAALPGVKPDKSSPFGWLKVKGSIDGFEIKNYKLMPMGNGNLFLPVKLDIRKKIGKKHGDQVKIILYPDHDPLEIPQEILDCFEDSPLAHKVFLSYTEGEQKSFIDWICSAKTDDTKAKRIATMISKLEKGKKLKDA